MSRDSKVISVFVGTRPEMIKLAPVIFELRKNPSYLVRIIFTGQHKELLTQTAKIFSIRPDCYLYLKRSQGTLSELAVRLMNGCTKILRNNEIDLVVVQGDTSTALIAALTAFYEGVAVAHVEAGLRTYDLSKPFPEESNRQIIARLASIHFAPTAQARKNLLSEGIDTASVVVTGNTAVDALQWVMRTSNFELWSSELHSSGERILVTIHRRESWHEQLHSICHGLKKIVNSRPQCSIVIPVHPGQTVKNTLLQELSGIPQIRLLDPQPYDRFVVMMAQSALILTDSGGVQEDACALHRPVLVLRDTTERQEAVKSGFARLVGTNGDEIASQVNRVLDNDVENSQLYRVANPFGDGHAATRIASAIDSWFAKKPILLSRAAEFHEP